MIFPLHFTKFRCNLFLTTQVCNPQPCPFWSQWSEWGACSQTCGAGNSSRSRSCVNGEIGEIGCESGGDSEMQVCKYHGRSQMLF